MNFYPFHIGDYLSHTAHLSDAEDLAYRRMLDLYYQTEQPFSDVAMVARRVRSDADTVQIILTEFFAQDDAGSWHHLRCDAEIAKYHSKADSARKANQARWASDRHLKSDPVQILTKNQEPITKNQEPKKSIKRASALPDEFQPSQLHYNLALSIGVKLDEEIAKFRDYHQAKGSVMKDWDAALRTWIRNAAEFSKRSTPAQRPSQQQRLEQNNRDAVERAKRMIFGGEA
jgi:uncharacterized protein YdaU (DUF1376 family)